MVTDNQHDERVKEVIEVRGLAAAIQAMVAPTFKNLKDLLRKLGWKLIRDDSNKQTNHESSNK